MRPHLLILVFILSATSISLSQILMDKIEGKTAFKEIQQIANEHYKQLNSGRAKLLNGDLKEKHWRRMEWFYASHLDENGRIADFRNLNFRAEKDIKKMEKEDSRSTNSFWYFTGPDRHIASPTSTHYIGLGRVDRIAFHPSNPSIIYIGTPAGGIWKTTNDGISWTPLDEFLPCLGVSGIVISPINPNHMYVLTGSGDGGGLNKSAGVFKSTDGGSTWNKTGALFSGDYSGFEIEMDPNNDQILLAATSAGVYKTTNGGDSWTRVYSLFTYDVKFKPFSSDTIYMCTNMGIYYSHNQGDQYTWNNAYTTINPVSGGRKAIAVTPANPNIVYVHTGGATGAGTFSGFYASGDGGVNYFQITNSPNLCGPDPNASNDQAGYDFCVAAHPTIGSTVVTGGLIVFRTSNGGGNWNQITTFGSGSSTPGYVHPDIHDIEYNPLNNNLYVATDGGFYKSIDGGNNWTNLSKGIRTTMFYALDVPAGNNTKVLGGSQDNGLKQRIANSTEMDHLALSDALCAKYDPNDHTVFYAGNNGGLTKYLNSGSTNSGVAPIIGPWYFQFETHPSNSNYIYTGLNNPDKFFISVNQGTSWDTLNIPAGNSISNCPTNGGRIYVAGNGDEINRLDNFGSTITPLHGNPGFPTGNQDIRDIAVHPSNSTHLVISLGGYSSGKKIYRSTNAGANWTNISGSLPNIPFHSVAIDANGDIYAGSDLGVFYLHGIDWIPFRNNLPATMVTDIVLMPSDNLMRISTYGRGIWTGVMGDGNCTPNLVWTAHTVLDGFKYYEAANTIENLSTIQGGIGTEVFFKAGSYIDLKVGFEAKNDGSFFEAYLGPCGTGVPIGN